MFLEGRDYITNVRVGEELSREVNEYTVSEHPLLEGKGKEEH